MIGLFGWLAAFIVVGLSGSWGLLVNLTGVIKAPTRENQTTNSLINKNL